MAKECSSTTCNKSSCEGGEHKNNPQSLQETLNVFSEVKHVIGVISGKGGVGRWRRKRWTEADRKKRS